MNSRISTIDAYIIEVSDDWMTLPTIHQQVLDKLKSIDEKIVPMPSLEAIRCRLHVIAENGVLEMKQIRNKYGGSYYMWRRNRRYNG